VSPNQSRFSKGYLDHQTINGDTRTSEENQQRTIYDRPRFSFFADDA